MEAENIRIIVLTEEVSSIGEQALPDISNIFREKYAAKTFNMNVDSLKSEMTRIISNMMLVFEDLPETSTYEVTSLNLALAFDAQGKIGIIGSVPGGSSISSGINVTLSKKKASE